MNPLAKLSQATTALAEARTLEEVTHIRDIAEAARTYAKAAQLGLDAQNHAAEIKLRAERKAGELLKQAKETGEIRGKGGNGSNHHEQKSQPVTFVPKLADLGISKMQSSRYQAVASLPQEKFEQHIVETKEAGKELTTADVLREAKAVQSRTERTAKINEIAKKNTPLNTETDRLYPIVYADPPWQYEHSETDSRKIENQYPTMTIQAICELPVGNIAAPDAVLFLWTTSPKLAESMNVISAWGFVYRTCIVWDKERMGMGYYARQQHELLLIAARGSIPVPKPENRPASIVRIKRDNEHSAKPEEFYSLIERMYPEYDRIELFARNGREGWFSWGNQA